MILKLEEDDQSFHSLPPPPSPPAASWKSAWAFHFSFSVPCVRCEPAVRVPIWQRNQLVLSSGVWCVLRWSALECSRNSSHMEHRFVRSLFDSAGQKVSPHPPVCFLPAGKILLVASSLTNLCRNVGLAEPVCGTKSIEKCASSLVAKRSLIGSSCPLSHDLFLSHCIHNLFINMLAPFGQKTGIFQQETPLGFPAESTSEKILTNLHIPSEVLFRVKLYNRPTICWDLRNWVYSDCVIGLLYSSWVRVTIELQECSCSKFQTLLSLLLYAIVSSVSVLPGIYAHILISHGIIFAFYRPWFFRFGQGQLSN